MKTIIVTTDTMEQSKKEKLFFQMNILDYYGAEDAIIENVNTGETITVNQLKKKHKLI